MILTARPLVGLLAAATATVALAGCSSAQPATTQPAQAPAPTASGAPGGGGQQRQPGTFGLIAAVTGSTMQVQGSSGQTAVTWTDATTFTETVAGSTADLTAGVCVSGFGEKATGSDAVTVSQLTVSQPVDGACTRGFGGGQPRAGATPPVGATPPSGAPGDGQPPAGMPTGAPGAMPSGAPGNGNGNGAMVSGTVASVSGSTVTVTEKAQDGSSSTVTATLAEGATVAMTTTAASSDVKVGLCASAQGDTDSTGAVTAKTVRLSQATDGACAAGGGRR